MGCARFGTLGERGNTSRRTRTYNLLVKSQLTGVISGDSATPSGTANPTPSSSPSSGAQNTSTTDPDLAAVIDAWPTLPEAVKAGIVAMVEAVRPTRRQP